MVDKLTKESKMKFIYAEISFFERWWRDIDETKRNSIKKYIDVDLYMFSLHKQISGQFHFLASLLDLLNWTSLICFFS